MQMLEEIAIPCRCVGWTQCLPKHKASDPRIYLCQLLPAFGFASRFFSTSSSNGFPIDTFVIAGGRSVRRAEVLKSLLRPLEGSGAFLRVDLLLDPSRIRLINFSGYSLRSHGLDTIRQALMMVALDSSTVHIVTGTI